MSRRNPRFRRGRISIAAALAAAALSGAPAAAQIRVAKLEPAPPSRIAGLAWRTLATEAEPDGARAALPDARALRYALDPDGERLWFAIDLHAPPHPDWFGFNVAIDTDQDLANGLPWWGANAAFRFDRLLSVYMNRAGGHYEGMVGVADASGIESGDFQSLGRDLLVVVDRAAPAFYAGVRRRDLGAAGPIRAIATVGSSFLPNDDLPDGFVTIEPPP